jgi:hypothetical protein
VLLVSFSGWGIPVLNHFQLVIRHEERNIRILMVSFPVFFRTPTKQSNRVSSLPAAAGSAAAAAALHNGGGATKLLNGAAAAGTNGVSSSDEDMDTN